MQNNSIQAFFTLIQAGLWEKEARLYSFGEVDYSAVMLLAEEQSVLGLVIAGLEHVSDVKVPKEVLLQYIGNTLQLEQRNKDMNVFVAKLIDELRQKDVSTILVKGQGIAQCYERPSWRSCGDVDLFLSDSNYNNAKDVLVPVATVVEQEYAREKHLGMTINGWEVELHGRLYSGLTSRIDRELDGVLNETFFEGAVRSWNNNGVQVFLLKPENDAFYVFTHILQHFYKEGVGLRQLCDWCRLLWTHRDNLNVQLLESRIKRAGLMTAWRAFGAFAVEYLGLPSEAMPFYDEDDSHNEKLKGRARRIRDYVLSVGNMGHNRDSCYYGKYPYLIRKCISMWRRTGDMIYHARIFPLDSLRFFPYIMFNGLRSAVRGEG